jgi:Fe-S oxidoreductase
MGGGRPLFDYGMLDTVECWLSDLVEKMAGYIQRGLPMVVLEPSCCAVFRDELVNLFPNNLNAQRLKQNTFLLSEFLHEKAPNYQPPLLRAEAIVHGHCHHHALMGMDAEKAVLERMGINFRLLESGCCGMAGAFGFEKGDHYDVSVKCGERVLLPEVRQAKETDLIIANGFSCQEQISQQTDRAALHLAQVLQLAIRGGRPQWQTDRPETTMLKHRQAEQRKANIVTVVFLAALGIGYMLWRHRKERRRLAI